MTTKRRPHGRGGGKKKRGALPRRGGAEHAISSHRHHSHLITLILPIHTPPSEPFTSLLPRIHTTLHALKHEILVIYENDAPTLEQSPRPPTLRLIKGPTTPGGALRTAIPTAAGDILILLDPQSPADIDNIPLLAAAIRDRHLALAVESRSRATGSLALIEKTLALIGGMGVWNPASGFRAYSADFLDHQTPTSDTLLDLNLELAAKAQLQEQPLGEVPLPLSELPPRSISGQLGSSRQYVAAALRAPFIVYGLWLTIIVFALAAIGIFRQDASLGLFINIAMPAAAVFALTLAVRRVRGRIRIADVFLSLILLNPWFYERSANPYDRALLAAGLLGLMAGAIIAMKRDKPLRYLAVALLALALTGISDVFIMMLPALVIWLIWSGYRLAKSESPAERLRGFIIMAAGEVDLLIFGLACILIEPTSTPNPATLFSTIVSFSEFPLLVIAIVMLGLGWRRGPTGETPPYLAGMLALLIGLLAMLLNNFQYGSLPPPATDQTVLILCLFYIVFALHGPRRLRWLIPPLLLIAAAAYTFFHSITLAPNVR